MISYSDIEGIAAELNHRESLYKQETGERFITTIDSHRSKMQYACLGLPEPGDDCTNFFTKKGTLIATGYLRIVYGDHGPYIEFLPKHMVRAAWKLKRKKGPRAWYDECVPKDDSKCLLYVQKRDVKTLPNPPRSGRWQVRQNRPEGYADYRPGRLYISPNDMRLEP